MSDLLESSKALLELDADNALVPRGLGGHGRKCLAWCVEEIQRLRNELTSTLEEISHHKMTQDDSNRLVRELDIALNGEAGAAKQAALCDIVGQVKDQRWTLVRNS